MGNKENPRQFDFEVSRDSAGRSLEIAVRENVNNVIRDEIVHGFKVDRILYDYLDELRGLEATFDYVRSLGSSKTIVDVGTGRGLAWSQLVQKYGNGLDCWATGLVDYDCNERFDGKFRNTPVEVMEGFETASVGGIIAVYSIAYGLPKPCIDRLDEILVPGGVIKACFCPSFRNSLRDGYEFKKPGLFKEPLEKLDYDIFISEEIVVAIKPGGVQKALDLMEKDFSSYKKIRP